MTPFVLQSIYNWITPLKTNPATIYILSTLYKNKLNGLILYTCMCLLMAVNTLSMLRISMICVPLFKLNLKDKLGNPEHHRVASLQFRNPRSDNIIN